MTTESEIKLLVDGHPAETLRSTLETHALLKLSDSVHLRNVYFDSPERLLHKLKIGLRARHGEDTGAEQTIKTAGKVVDGLHQRAEYNAPLSGEVPSLADFPQEIWPQGTDVAALQQVIAPLFSTDFDRQRWVVEFAGSVIEVVWDHGEIRAGEKCAEINEVELELKQGEVADLFGLAEKISAEIATRPGELSKAARGYALALG